MVIAADRMRPLPVRPREEVLYPGFEGPLPAPNATRYVRESRDEDEKDRLLMALTSVRSMHRI